MAEIIAPKPPLVSIVTPVYNGAEYLEEFIRSVQEQDYPRIEHLIIDDGSTDGGATVEILKRYPHLRWWSRPNKGAYATMNEGLKAAKGEYVNIINADDKYATPQAISSAMQVLLNNPLYDAVYGDTLVIDAQGRPFPFEGPLSGPVWIFRYYAGAIAHPSLVLRRDFILQKNIFFDEALIYAADYDWVNRLILAGCRFYRIQKPISAFRVHPAQRSNDPVSSARRAEYDLLNKKYPTNRFVLFCVRRWISLVHAKNYLARAGLVAFLRESVTWTKRRLFRKKQPLQRSVLDSTNEKDPRHLSAKTTLGENSK